jgi:predicted glycosyltransferase
LQLAELDASFGFCSSFNFIPEGDYADSSAVRAQLARKGFEVGVHDLKHDGFLYQSRKSFQSQAQQINKYLKAWNASGFRSGFMHHNLEWFDDLDILYDASTFDTDPFEPQPDGVDTIFPFWVPGKNGSGYVELPYTLVQDFNLFIVLQEESIDIWKKKLDWIVAKGGMALLIVHPDYTNFSNSRLAADEFPAQRYAEFLKYVQETYAGLYWNALPCEVAEMVRSRRHLPASGQAKPKPSPLVAPLAESRHVNGAAPASNRPAAKRNGAKPPVWIDLDNTPHVVFFEPIIDELRARGFPLTVTARDAFQVCELADQKKISYEKIGRHYGKNRFLKVTGVLYRAMQLAPVAWRDKPVLSLSHGARSQIVISNLLRIPTLLFADYEFAEYPPLMRPTWEMVPSVIPDEALCCDQHHIKKYPGIKEDVYAWKFEPDAALLQSLGMDESSLIITARPPATEAHYHNPESEGLFTSFMDMACHDPRTRIVLLPRNKQQGELIRSQCPQWFVKNKTVIPGGALDGLNLIWHSDLLVSGGGTMNREAATLGVPVYSIFRGAIGAVDRHLQHDGRLVLVESAADVAGKIKLEKRVRRSVAETTSRKSLDYIVNTIEELVEGISAKGGHH